jgi:hypothetical protein
VKRDLVEVLDCGPKAKRELTNLERELAKLKEEMTVMGLRREPLAPPAAVKMLWPPRQGNQFHPSVTCPTAISLR